MNKEDHIKEIEARAKAMSNLIEDDGTEILAGQVRDQGGVRLLVLKNDNDVVQVSAMLTGHHSAGPNDFKIDSHIMGYNACISFSLTFSLLKTDLGTCIGRLEYEDFATVMEGYRYHNNVEFDDDYKPDKELAKRMLNRWGYNYIDEEDLRWKEHEELCGKIEKLQMNLINDIWGDE